MKRALSYFLLVVLALAVLPLPATAQKGHTAETQQELGLTAALRQILERLAPSIAGSHAGMDPDGKPSREGQVPLEDPDSHAGMDPDGKS
jgi:hypothetical protein